MAGSTRSEYLTMPILAIVVGLGAAVATAVGGLVAFRVKDHRHLVLGAAGGVVLGVVSFDLLPEAIRSSHAAFRGIPVTMLMFVAGFLTIHLISKALASPRGRAPHYAPHRHDVGPSGLLAAGALVGHSFFDGLTIGVSFGASAAVATAAVVAVVAHDFADGFNTYTLTTMSGSGRRQATALLIADATAPVAGATAGSVIHLSTAVVALYLAYFAGFLMHVATATILPEAHADHPSWGTLAATVLGVLFMGGVVSIIG
jgi:ZIP family zinc transporter